MQHFKNLIQLQNYFSNEKVSMDYLEQQRWQGNPICPHCGSEHHYRTKTRFKNPELKDYKDFTCKSCMKKYTVLTGTIYESSKISLRLWFSALYLLSSHKKGISSVQLAKDIGVTQKTAWFILHRLRETIKDLAPEILIGDVEADETFVGGKNKNRHWDKKTKYLKENNDREFKDKTPVLGLLQKGGNVRCFVVPDTKTQTLLSIVYNNIAPGSTLHTDEWHGYKSISNQYNHVFVFHGKGEYKNSHACTNTIEGFWSILKRGIIGIYHYVSRKHLQRYCEEFAYRYNYRHLSDVERFENAFKYISSARMTYNKLIGKQEFEYLSAKTLAAKLPDPKTGYEHLN